MIKRRTPIKPQPRERYCGECALGKPVMKFTQLDIYGKPICVRCPHDEWSRVRSQKACAHFRPKIR